MISAEEIKKLADLSLLEISGEEEEVLRRDIDSILAYVGEIKEAAVEVFSDNARPANRNVFRSDMESLPSGRSGEELLNLAPSRQSDFIKVKKIL